MSPRRYAVLGLDGQPVLPGFDTPESFERGVGTPAIGSDESLFLTPNSPEIIALRDGGLQPLNVSPYTGAEARHGEFLSGAKMMGMLSGGKSLKPQQWQLADACNAVSEAGLPLNLFMSILMPRRSTKSTSILALALGRCIHRPGYLVGYTVCTTGLKARDRFHKDIVPPLEKQWKDPKTRPFKIMKSGGSERIIFPNGSIFQVLPPDGDAFRSDAYDLIVFDEAGEATPEMGKDLLAGAAATLDTRPEGQMFVAGTGAKFRKGNLLWDGLEDGRLGQNSTGIVDFSAPDSTSEDELADWEPTEDHPDARVRELTEMYHPGVNTLTTIERMKLNFVKLGPGPYSQEYLGIFGNQGVTAGIINMDAWGAGRQGGRMPEPPNRFALVAAVHPTGKSSCLVAVWRVRGRAKVLLLEQPKVDKLVDRALHYARKYRVPIVHDTNGPITVEAEELARAKPRVKLQPQSFPNVKTAAALLVKEIDLGNVDHWDQPELNEAASLTKKRSVGPTAWALGRADELDDITPIEAAAMGLRVYDDTKAPSQTGIVIAA